MSIIQLKAPLLDNNIAMLRAGDKVLISGVIYTARDAAHSRLAYLLELGQDLPIDLQGQIIYYAGPTPAKPGRIIGSVGPTTSYRMDPYTPQLLKAGLKGVIGKGTRSQAVRTALQDCKSVYMAALGGAAALISKCITKAKLVAYPDLGPEAIYRLEVNDLPVVVINDCYGSDLYEEGINKYNKLLQEKVK
ncbi:Fe-S-containing hydro-lyase [Bacillota bacterium LX-D]|nr:Fe-S-containing hydro-lyase [Bacillota bacterium LX-D]